MVLVGIFPVIGSSSVNIDYLHTYYPKDITYDAKLFFIISRVFNDRFKQIEIDFETPFQRSITEKSVGSYSSNYFLQIEDILESYHIAQGYNIEIIVQYVSSKNRIKTVFPGETRYFIHPQIEGLINKLESKKVISPLPENVVRDIIAFMEPHEVATKLSSLNYETISDDLIQSIRRFESGDNDGSIKFSRKVVEGIRNLDITDIVPESNRQDKLKSYLNASFNLLSNFGEHTGTSASQDEALLSKDIALGLSQYLVSKYVI